MAIINQTRHAASALRKVERGWDWDLVRSPDGFGVEPMHVSVDEAEAEANQLLIGLMETSKQLRAKEG